MIGYYIAAISIMGVWLNNYKDARCFYFWIFSNAAWMIIDFQASTFDGRLLAQSIQHGVFFILAIHGARVWGMK